MKRKKRRLPRILLSLLGLIVLAAIVFGIWQRVNILAFMVSKQYSSDDLVRMIADKGTATEQIMKKLPEVYVRTPTDEEKEQLHAGTLTETELVELILKPLPQKTQPTGNDGGDTPGIVTPGVPEVTEVPEMNELQTRIAGLIAEMYVLREGMSNKLDDIMEAAKSEYNALPKSERTAAKKQSIILQRMNEASQLESVCDTKVDGILKELRELLQASNGDIGIAAEIRKAYNDEKTLKKSYFISQYS